MNTVEKIGKIEAIALFITVVFNNLILNIPSIIINVSGTGAWINLIYITVIAIVFILLICKFFKPFVGADIIDVSQFVGGKFLKYFIAFLYIALFIIFSAFCLRFFANSLRLLYFNDTPLVLLMLLFLVPVCITSYLGLKAVSGNNLIIASFSFIAFFVFISSASGFFVWQRLFPVLGYGIKTTIFNNITNLFAFNVVAYLYFLKPFLKNESDFKKLSLIAVILCGFFLLFGIATLIMSFSFITRLDETLSVFIMTRLITFGNFVQRVDAIITFIWIFVVLSFLSFNIYIISYIIKKSINLKSQIELSFPISAIVFAIGLSFKDIASLKFISKNIYPICSFVLIFIISFVILLLGYFKKRRKR